jgi:hypothetical protein
MGIVVPGVSWCELFRGKPPRKEKEAERKKGDISNEVRKGTFLKSFDSDEPSSVDGVAAGRVSCAASSPSKLDHCNYRKGGCDHA